VTGFLQYILNTINAMLRFQQQTPSRSTNAYITYNGST